MQPTYGLTTARDYSSAAPEQLPETLGSNESYWERFLRAMRGNPDAVDPNRGSEQTQKGTLMKGGSQLLEGIWGEEAKRRADNRDIAFKNAEMQQAYQNNLPAMLKARQGSRERASTLASLAGLY